jgi:copper chaperone
MAATETVTTHLTVSGMTCGHCAVSVNEGLSEIAGVEHVDVVLESGAVTITSADPLDPADVEAAVVEAGYSVG